MYMNVSVGMHSESACMCMRRYSDSMLSGLCFFHSAIPRAQSMHGSKDACYQLGVCDRQGEPGSGSPLFYINTWSMVWPNDYQALAT